jgi:hypothetical protein
MNDPKDKQWWQWMYRNGPLGPAAIIVAVVKQKIIGHHAGILVPIKIGDKVTRGGHGLDLMVHPDYRRQGLFIAMSKTLNQSRSLEHRSISYGTPNDQSRPGFVNTLNSMEICKVPRLDKVVDWGTVLKRRYKIPAFIGKLFGYAWERIIHPLPSGQAAGIEIEEVLSFDERINQFWEKASKLKNIMIAKDMKYLNWRYVAKPGKEYDIFIAKKQQEIIGFIVSKLERDVLQRGYIVDLLTLPEEATVAGVLIAKAMLHLKEAGAVTISCCMLKDTPYYPILRNMGFTHHPGPRLCSRVIDMNIPKDLVTNPANWYYVMGDDDTR